MTTGDKHLNDQHPRENHPKQGHEEPYSPPRSGQIVSKRLSFLICGAQKSGTTALAAYLRQHPLIHLPEKKELHFFDDETQAWPEPDLIALHNHFQTADSDQIWGEATPISLYWDPTPERIWRYNPAMRLIVILRNPIERAYSHWAMEHRRGNDLLPFALALEQEEERCLEALPQQHRIFSYVDRGFYSAQLRRLWRFFGRDQVLVLRQEELRVSPQTCLERIWKHLSIPPGPAITALTRHSGNYDSAMAPDCRERLRKIFWHEISQLEYMLGWNCSDWLRS